MSMNDKYKKAQEITAKWNQDHLLQFYDELPDTLKETLLDSVLTTDFDLIGRLFHQAQAGQIQELSSESISPFQATDRDNLTAEEINRATALGMNAIRSGQYAVVTMAGGQGTRLGYDGPKGTFEVDLGKPKSLFEVQLERIKAASRQATKPIPWYIMTSGENHEATVDYFTRNDYFGYPDISFFQQGSLPMVDMDGKILLEDKHKVKQGPDGNGSIFRAIQKTGIADDMKRRGIQWFFICNVDNILAQCTDPLPIGLAIQRGLLCTSKSVLKRSPDEKAGVFCLKNSHPCVIEYTEIPAELAQRTNASGTYEYGDAHISCTLFHIDVLGLKGANQMPYHTAVKKAPYIDDKGLRIAPEKANAFKFEAFIFDVFQSFDDMIVLRVPREEEFAPIKNALGEDSPETAKALYLEYVKER